MSAEGSKTLSEAERKEIKEAFDTLDSDGDGKLSTDELRTLVQATVMVITDEEVAKILKTLDVDGSGTIEYDEFEKYVIDNSLSKPTAEEFSNEMRDAFEMFDLDKDGFIDAHEFKNFMTTLGDKMSEEEVEEMMREIDTNGDGKIDYKEFCRHMMKSM